MALELEAIPIKIHPDTLAILRSEAELTGKHMKEIAREVLKEWSDRQVHIARLRHKHLTREGFDGVDRGFSD